jgi:hypothetical protein
MSSFKTLSPDDIDESLMKLVEFAGRRQVLLPFVDATGAAPEYRSLGHATENSSVRLEDLEDLAKAMRSRAGDAAEWFLLFNTPWLLRRSDGDAVRKPDAGRR